MLYDLLLCPDRVSMDLFDDPAGRDKIGPFVRLLWGRGTLYEKEAIEGLEEPLLTGSTRIGMPHDCRKGGANLEIEHEIGEAIEFRWVAVEDDQPGAVPLSHDWQAGGGVNDQGRPDAEKQITGQGFIMGTAHGVFGHCLTEGDGRRLHRTPATAAHRQGPIGPEGLTNRIQFVVQAAVEAVGVGRVAVKFDDSVVRHSRRLVQSVDVLGYDAGCGAPVHQFCDGAMAPVWPGLLDGIVGGELASPGFVPHLGGSNEVVEIDGPIFIPDAVRTAEIGNAGLGRDAGTREYDGAASVVEKAPERVDGWGERAQKGTSPTMVVRCMTRRCRVIS